MSEETAIVPVVTPQAMSNPIRMSLETVQGFEALQRAARMFASSNLVPKAYQGNIANCVIALNIALRMQADPLMVLQSLDIIHGRPSWRATFLIAAVNNSGRYSPLRFVFTGVRGQDSWGCRAVSKDLRTGTELSGAEITIGMAKAQGWYSREGSKWQSMPEQMLMYRAASWWTRTYAPDVTMGFATTDEVVDELGAQAGPPASDQYEVANITVERVAPAASAAVEVEPFPKEPEAKESPTPQATPTQTAEPSSPPQQASEQTPPPPAARAPTGAQRGKGTRGVEAVRATLERMKAQSLQTQPSLLPDSNPNPTEGKE